MKKGEPHPSTKLYQEFILQAFSELVLEKDFSDITITEICTRAQISRRTFYRHFDRKEAIVECYTLQLMGTLADTLAAPLQADDLFTFVKSFFSFLEPYTVYIQAFTKNGFGDLVFTCYLKCLIPLFGMVSATVDPRPSVSSKKECLLAYTLGGLWSLFSYWMSHGCIQTPDELADIVAARQDFIDEGLL